MPYFVPTKAKTLSVFAILLLLLGILAASYDPYLKGLGFHPSLRSYLADSIVAAALSGIFAYYASRRKEWAVWSGAGLAFVLLANNVKLATQLLKAIALDETRALEPRWFECSLLWLRGFISLAILLSLLLYLRREKPLTPQS